MLQPDGVQLAPVAVMPSSGPRSMFSFTSENSLPSAPAVWKATAMIAGTGEEPSMKIRNRARISARVPTQGVSPGRRAPR